MVIVTNTGKYAITNLDARLSPDGESVVNFSMTRAEIDLFAASAKFGRGVTGTLAIPPASTLAAGATITFLGDEQTVKRLARYVPIVRWTDHWEDCWEYRQGEVYQIAVDAPWLESRPDSKIPVDE